MPSADFLRRVFVALVVVAVIGVTAPLAVLGAMHALPTDVAPTSASAAAAAGAANGDMQCLPRGCLAGTYDALLADCVYAYDGVSCDAPNATCGSAVMTCDPHTAECVQHAPPAPCEANIMEECLVGACDYPVCYYTPSDDACPGAETCTPRGVCVPSAHAEHDARLFAGDVHASNVTARAEAMCSGASHICTAGASVRCVGLNTRGQLGMPDSLPISYNFVEAAVGAFCSPENPCADVTCGDYFTCVLASDGRVACFGDPSGGCTGRASTQYSASTSYMPAFIMHVPPGQAGAVPFLATSVSAGRAHVCATAAPGNAGVESGRVYCWGSNTNGELRQAHRDPSDMTHLAEPTDQLVPTADRPPLYVSSGSYATCALVLVENGTSGAYGVRCWGSASIAIAGQGAYIDLAGAGVRGLAQTSGGIELAVGTEHACVHEMPGCGVEGHVYCWGRNTYGQFGFTDGGGVHSVTRIGAPIAANRLTVNGYTTCMTLLGSPSRAVCYSDFVPGTSAFAPGDAPLRHVECQRPFAAFPVNGVSSVGITITGDCVLV